MRKTLELPSCVNLDLDRLPAQSHVDHVNDIPVIDQARYGVPFRKMW